MFSGGISAGSASIEISHPVALQVMQRTAASTGIVRPIIHVTTPATQTVELRVNAGAWTSIGQASMVTVMSPEITCPVGAVTIEARISGGPSTSVSFLVGDVFALWGQSNISGRLTNNQPAPSSGASMFGNDWIWKPLSDPVDSDIGQRDVISSDADSLGMGSVWPLVASKWLAATNIPIGFIPCSKGSTSFGLSQPSWVPAADPFDRGTLFGSAMSRVRKAGPVRAILWWQGEGGFDEVSGNAYVNAWSNMATVMQAEFPGVKIMLCKIHECPGVLASRQVNLWNAIGRIWSEKPTLSLVGPTIADAPVGNASNILGEVEGGQPQPWFHIKTNQNADAAATRWANRMVSQFQNI